MKVLRFAARLGANILDQTRIARRPLGIALAAALALCVAPALAQTPVPAAPAPVLTTGGGIAVGGESHVNLFEARAVPVDVTAASVVEARDRAFTDGRVAALHVVLERLVARGDLDRLPQISASDVIDMVQEFSVANERTSNVRYLADLTVRFNPEAVRRLLRGAHIAFSESISRPLVVLPVYVDGARGTAVLWDGFNPWREAFAHLQNANGLVPLILPVGDAQDARLKMEQVNARDAAALGALAVRYGAGGVVIAKATVNGSGDPVQIVLTEVRGLASATDTVMSTPTTAGQSREDMLAAAAGAVIDGVSDNWKRQSRVSARDSVVVTALVSLTDLKDWVQTKEALRNVPMMEKVELQAMTRDRAQVTLRYGGDPSTLGLALAQQGLVATQQGGVWMLSLPRAAAAASQ